MLASDRNRWREIIHRLAETVTDYGLPEDRELTRGETADSKMREEDRNSKVQSGQFEMACVEFS